MWPTLSIYAERRWSFARISIAWLILLAVCGLQLFGSYVAITNPSAALWRLDDGAAQWFGIVTAATFAPYLLSLAMVVTLQTTGVVPLLVLKRTADGPHVASWLGSHGLSRNRLTIVGAVTWHRTRLARDPFDRDIIEWTVNGRSLRVQTFGTYSDASLDSIRQWLEECGVRVGAG